MKIAIITYLLFALAGLSCLVAGVYVLHGQGYALIASGIAFLLMSFFISRGLRSQPPSTGGFVQNKKAE
ncbi:MULTISPECIES: hypothetical protein [unclassified Vibrio]|uniref:hypothetical protein n=1 Tax=unclassified Vibrio TaxID=2614977 RepID=UPI000B8E823C|nr:MULTISPECIES: hypothetical protein [unclassified Vibrio]NAX17189.1 hypothetical protein [Vibrio sp. V22_P2S10T140]OXX47818.1 hypothetical protein B9J83_03760 [Vibrio sp. V07_P2A8T137]OXX58185.1 hypothetical protein B9J82_08845 [Vibrio sp. V10_P2A27P122]PSD42852.1 hypothetical protein C7E22_03520 [Vibrio sp. V02_P2A34T13]